MIQTTVCWSPFTFRQLFQIQGGEYVILLSIIVWNRWYKCRMYQQAQLLFTQP